MSTIHIVPNAPDFTECIICGKPLGQESRDLRYRTCNDHRACSICGKPLKPHEIRLAHERLIEDSEPIEKIELVHPSCQAITHPSPEAETTLSVKQSYYDYLNMLRLCIEPDMELGPATNEQNAMIQTSKVLSEWSDFDKAYLFLKKLEACIAQVSIALAQDRKKLKERADAREKEKFVKAQEQAKVSARPTGKKEDDVEEILIAQFMAEHDVSERKVAMKIRRDIEKAVEATCKMSGKTDSSFASQIRATLIESMVKNGSLKK